MSDVWPMFDRCWARPMPFFPPDADVRCLTDVWPMLSPTDAIFFPRCPMFDRCLTDVLRKKKKRNLFSKLKGVLGDFCSFSASVFKCVIGRALPPIMIKWGQALEHLRPTPTLSWLEEGPTLSSLEEKLFTPTKLNVLFLLTLDRTEVKTWTKHSIAAVLNLFKPSTT